MKQNLTDRNDNFVVAEGIADVAAWCTVLNVPSREKARRATKYKVIGTVRDALTVGDVKGYSGTIRVKTTVR